MGASAVVAVVAVVAVAAVVAVEAKLPLNFGCLYFCFHRLQIIQPFPDDIKQKSRKSAIKDKQLNSLVFTILFKLFSIVPGVFVAVVVVVVVAAAAAVVVVAVVFIHQAPEE